MFDYKRALTRTGVVVVLGGSASQLIQGALFPLLLRDKRIRGVMARPNQQDLVVLKELLETGKIVSVIDRKYSLADVPAAISYLLGGHSSGKVIIAVSGQASLSR
jgi:NADPH:quinone reductase-like Zn-dependent oxidoreductase